MPTLPVLAGLVLGGVVVWSYGGPLATLVRRWWNEPDYVYGFLVPVFSAWLLWHRRDLLAGVVLKGSWWGLALLAVCGAMRAAAAYLFVAPLEPLSLMPCLAGVTLFVAGWKALQWAGPSIAFLFFMVPLPEAVAGILSHPLQRIGTIASTYVLQTLGIPAIAQGNVIVLTEAHLGVVEACSGLRMMMLFFAVCCGAAMALKRPMLDRILIALSAPPIALLANVLRITVTGLLHETASREVADWVFHDLAGFFMMPAAVVVLWTEAWLISRLLLPPAPAGPVALGMAMAGSVGTPHGAPSRGHSKKLAKRRRRG